MELAPDRLATARFGIEVAHGSGHGAELGRLAHAARARDVDLVIVRCDAADVAGTHALEDTGARLMDTHVTYACVLPDGPPDAPDPRIRPARPDDHDAVTTLARAAFADYVGHFHTDERLAPRATDVYVDWTQRVLADASGDQMMWLAEDAQGPLGFATLRLEGDEAAAVLDAVDTRARGTGLHGVLLRHRMVEAGRRGATRMVYRTHLANVAARRSVIRHGFLPTTQEHTFHLWLDDQEPGGPA